MGPVEIAHSESAMARRPVVLATVCAIGGAVVAALLMARGRDADDIRMAALQRRLDTLESRVAVSQAPSGVPGTVALRDQGAPPPATRDHTEKLSNPRGVAMPDEQAALPFMDPAAAAERRRYEAGVMSRRWRRSRSTWPPPIRSPRASSRPSAGKRSLPAINSSMPSAEPRCAALLCSSVATTTWMHSLAVSAVFQASKTPKHTGSESSMRTARA